MIGLEDSPRSSALDRDWLGELYPDLRAWPRWGTPRNPSRETLGPQVAAVAAQFHTPLMPWQRLVADVGLELDPDGKLHYKAVVVTIHRQAGKTTLLLPWEVHRCLAWKSRQRVVYTAQTLQAARGKFVDEQQQTIRDSMFGSLGHPRNERGSEAWIWANGSQIGIMAAGKKPGHGFSNGLVVVDEAWAHTGWRLDQALRPTMIRVPESQWITISTTGDESSVYLLEQVRRGRHLVESGKDERVAFFEWSIPLDEDMDDPAVWAKYMPALGLGISVDDLRAQRAMMPDAEFRRAFGNQWVDGETAQDSVIPQRLWQAMADPKSKLDVDLPMCVSVDVAPDQSTSSIAWAGTDLNGLEHLEAPETRPGSDWVVGRVVEMCRHNPRFGDRVALDMSTPAGGMVPAFEEAGLEVVPVSGRDWNAACAALMDAAQGEEFRHIDDPELNKALASAAQKGSGDGWHWKRRGQEPITPLCAITLAHWALVSGEKEPDYDPLDSFF